MDLRRELFPSTDQRRLRWTDIPGEQISSFTMGELMPAIETIKTKKAPGTDKIPREAIKIIAEVMLKAMLDTLNGLLE